MGLGSGKGMLGPWIREGPYRAFYVLYRALGLGTGVFERKRDIARACPEKRGPFIAEIAAGVTLPSNIYIGGFSRLSARLFRLILFNAKGHTLKAT